jgi:ribosomal protein L5
MLIKDYYNNILRKDLILKVFPIDVKNIPEIEKLEIRIIFPKIIDDFSQVFDGIIYLEELTGQFPINKILSVKRVGAESYERSVLIKVTLRKERIYNFILYLSISLLFYWEESKNILLVKASADPKNKIVQLSNKEFFLFF